MGEQVVGHLAELWRYPVKSMAGERLDHGDLSWHGIAGDRRWAFLRSDVPTSGFPWLTIRQHSELCRYEARLLDPSRPDASPAQVTTPAGRSLAVTDPDLAAELGEGLRLLKQDRGAFDSMPISLITLQAVAAVSAMAEVGPDPRRFRPNLVVDAAGGDGFPEDAWVGRTLRIGGARMRVDRRDGRCVIINVDPGTAERDPLVLRTVARRRDAELGVYGSTVTPGPVAVGDAVVLE